MKINNDYEHEESITKNRKPPYTPTLLPYKSATLRCLFKCNFHSRLQELFLCSVFSARAFPFFFSEKKKRLKLVVAVRANQSITDVQCAALRLHSLCILQGGAEDFFFSGSFFYIPPQGPYKFSEPPKQSAEKLIPPLPPPPSQEISK